MIVDAHHHLWTADYPWLADDMYAPIRRDYTVEQLRDNLHSAGIDACVLVESGRGTAAETTGFLELAADTREIAGVVGWASLSDPHLAAVIGKHLASIGGQFLVGVRDHVHEHADDFLDRPDVRRGLSAVADTGLVNELNVRTDQLPSLARLAEAMPAARFVLDQLGSPWVTGGVEGVAEWRSLIEPVAACDNVAAKLSGLVTLARWDAWGIDDLRPYVDSAIDLFGTDRLMFGSDWPVCELAASYGQAMDAMVSLLGGLPTDIFAGTAISTYRLTIDRSSQLLRASTPGARNGPS